MKNIRWQPFLFTLHSPYWTRMTCWHSSSFDTSFYSASTRLVPISTTMKSLLFIQRSELLVFNMADSSFISVGSLLHAAAERWAWRWQWVTATRVYSSGQFPRNWRRVKTRKLYDLRLNSDLCEFKLNANYNQARWYSISFHKVNV